MMRKTVVANLYGGPGCGKSGMAYTLCGKMKWRGISCELVPEYAKDCVWGDNTNILKNQLYVFGKQQNRLFRVNGKVDVAVTDSPLMLSVVYDILERRDLDDSYRKTFHELIIKEQARYETINIMLKRMKPYLHEGRMQTEAEARAIDQKIVDVLDAAGVKYCWVDGVEESAEAILDAIQDRVAQLK